MSDGPDSGLRRWSERKHAARLAARGAAAPIALKEADEFVAPDVAPTPTPDLPVDAVPSEERATAQAPADARPPLPPIEELTAESDYTQFLADGVPEALKHAALRKLWTSDPVLACLDGLNDYDEDFNVIDQVITAAQTNYKVGRGYLDMDEPEAVEPMQVSTEIAHETEPVVGSEEDKSESEAGATEVAAEDENPSAPADKDRPRQFATDATEAAPAPSGDGAVISKG